MLLSDHNKLHYVYRTFMTKWQYKTYTVVDIMLYLLFQMRLGRLGS